jgi:hypothetical protein
MWPVVRQCKSRKAAPQSLFVLRRHGGAHMVRHQAITQISAPGLNAPSRPTMPSRSRSSRSSEAPNNVLSALPSRQKHSTNSSASLSRSSRNLPLDLPEAFVKVLRNCLLILKCYRKTSTPIVQKLKLLMGRHFFPSRISHNVPLLRCDEHERQVVSAAASRRTRR